MRDIGLCLMGQNDHIKPLRPQTEKSCYTTCTNPNVDYDGSTQRHDEAELIAEFTRPYESPCKGLETVQRSMVALAKVQHQL